ncbi:conserved membrane protein of unknown function [Georgfuchsia toluolica]|uniref:DUF2231 domain-containing protein n=1 Tax=Georgfuchsia toluolica TaxID=424218 RepID=A0A916NIV1_9PROT|nr:DUF2231 domain-containing protein [Georgfuchsia toluolica]CAG4884968.1 conserved membrane protein of unknown function [Georgfuchsia toluolica]
MPEIIPNLHPLLVHFPIALLSVAAFFHVTAIGMRGKSCATHCAVVAHAALWLGALAALPAAFFGWQAFNSVNHDEAGHAAMLVHRSWALATLVLLAVLAGWDAWRNKVEAIPEGWFATAVIAAWAMVAVTAWHGGELVYRHGLGVMALPEAEAGHGSHNHGVMTNGEGHPHADVLPEDNAHEHSPYEHTH